MLNGENRLMGCLRRLFRNDDGATMVEYGLIAALISVSVIAGMRSIGTQMDAVFQVITDALATYLG